jgi:hypothetical protein
MRSRDARICQPGEDLVCRHGGRSSIARTHDLLPSGGKDTSRLLAAGAAHIIRSA